MLTGSEGDKYQPYTHHAKLTKHVTDEDLGWCVGQREETRSETLITEENLRCAKRIEKEKKLKGLCRN